MENKVAEEKRKPQRFFFVFLAQSHFGWLCYILGKRDKTECESRENAV